MWFIHLRWPAKDGLALGVSAWTLTYLTFFFITRARDFRSCMVWCHRKKNLSWTPTVAIFVGSSWIPASNHCLRCICYSLSQYKMIIALSWFQPSGRQCGRGLFRWCKVAWNQQGRAKPLERSVLKLKTYKGPSEPQQIQDFFIYFSVFQHEKHFWDAWNTLDNLVTTIFLAQLPRLSNLLVRQQTCRVHVIYPKWMPAIWLTIESDRI